MASKLQVPSLFRVRPGTVSVVLKLRTAPSSTSVAGIWPVMMPLPSVASAVLAVISGRSLTPVMVMVRTLLLDSVPSVAVKLMVRVVGAPSARC
ncbi:hypothetical protein D9M68_935940 [compost metagenome]